MKKKLFILMFRLVVMLWMRFADIRCCICNTNTPHVLTKETL